MTKKDYALIADSLRLSGELRCNSIQDWKILKLAIRELADQFGDSRFDKEKFLIAAGIYNLPIIVSNPEEIPF